MPNFRTSRQSATNRTTRQSLSPTPSNQAAHASPRAHYDQLVVTPWPHHWLTPDRLRQLVDPFRLTLLVTPHLDWPIRTADALCAKGMAAGTLGGTNLSTVTESGNDASDDMSDDAASLHAAATGRLRLLALAAAELAPDSHTLNTLRVAGVDHVIIDDAHRVLVGHKQYAPACDSLRHVLALLDQPKLTAVAQPMAGRELALLASALGRPAIRTFHVGLDLARATHWVCPADTWSSKMKVTLAALRYQHTGRVAIVTRSSGNAEAVCRALADAYGIPATCPDGFSRSMEADARRVEHSVAQGSCPMVTAMSFAELEEALERQAHQPSDLGGFQAMIFWSEPADLDQYVRLAACLASAGKRPFALTLAPSPAGTGEASALKSAPPAQLFAHLADYLATARRRSLGYRSTESSLFQAIPFTPDDVRSALLLMAEQGLASCMGPTRHWQINRPLAAAELRRLTAIALVRHARKVHAMAWWRRFEEAKRDRLAILRNYFEAPGRASHPLTKSRASASVRTSPATCASRMTSSTRPNHGPGSMPIMADSEAPSTSGGGATRSR